MQTVPLELSDVIYNAATQSFEARVIVHDQSGTCSYACAINAPITMEFQDAAKGLATQALRRHTHGRPDAMRVSSDAPTQRAGRMTGWRKRILDRFATGQAHAA